MIDKKISSGFRTNVTSDTLGKSHLLLISYDTWRVTTVRIYTADEMREVAQALLNKAKEIDEKVLQND